MSRPPADFANFVADAVQRNTSEFITLSRRHRIAQEVWDYLHTPNPQVSDGGAPR